MTIEVPSSPKVLISYSWDSDAHKAWVAEFATRLRKDGVDVILDQWHLHGGMDRFHFMETSVNQSNRVLLIGTPKFAEKSNERKGGVGWESTVITAELAENLSQAKFIPILRQGTFATALPSWLKSRVGFDLSSEPYFEDEYKQLLRVLHGETVQAPPLGKRPNFGPSLQSATTSTTPFKAVEAMDGSGRFRPKGTSLGVRWEQYSGRHLEVPLRDGPVAWLRVMPLQQPDRTWSAAELKSAGSKDGSWLLPFFGSSWSYLRSDDGIGVYCSFDPAHEIAFSSVFAFETGEVWSVDTNLLSEKKQIYVTELVKELVDKLPNYGGFLAELGINGPYKWVAGLDAVKGMHLMRPQAYSYIDTPLCLADQVSASGEFAIGDDPNAVLYPFLKKLYEKCGLPAPSIFQVGVQLPTSSERRLNAIAYAYFDKKGTGEQIKLYVRPTATNGIYVLETIPGSEVRGSKNEIADRYAQTRRELVRAGFTQMTLANASPDRAFD